MNLFFFKSNSKYSSSIKWGLYSVFINFGKQILLVPAFILSVGNEDFAFWIIISTIVLMIRALNLGQLNYTTNKINLNYHLKENVSDELFEGQGANILLVLLQCLFSLIISIPMVLAFITDLNTDYLLSKNAQWAFLFLALSRIIYQFCTLYLLRLFEPLDKINITVKYQTLGELIDFIVTFIVILITKSVFLACLAIFISNILYSLYVYNYVKKNIPFHIPIIKGVKVFKSFKLIKDSIVFSISFIIEKIYEIGLNLVVVQSFSAKVVPLFSTNRVMSNSALKVSNIMAVPLMPDIQKSYSLQKVDEIFNKMHVFWKISSSIIIISITLILPFIPFLFKLWTANKIEFNYFLIYYLMIAIVFQNYSTIYIELLKKTNSSYETLIYNVLKVLVCVISLFVSGTYNNYSGIGLSLLLGELFGTFYLILIVKHIFAKMEYSLKVFNILLPIILFSFSIFIYLYHEQYFIFLLMNCIALIQINISFFKKIINKY